MSEYTSYYLYQKYQKIGDGDWTPVSPSVFSVNGDGTMPLSAKTENDPNCGYVPEAIYRWVNMDISTNWICDDCSTPQYRTVSTAFTCVGYDKHYLDEYQVSYDSGVTWTTLSSSTGSLIETDSEYCGYVPPTPTGTKVLGTFSGGTTYSLECNSSTTLVQDEISSVVIKRFVNATIGNCVTSIGESVFNRCDALTSVTISNSVTSIGSNAFYQCSSLTSITIPNSVTSIGNSTFSDCTGLTSITIPNSVTSIGDYAFSNCSSLTTCTIGSGVTSIGSNAFYQCSSLTSITIPNSVTSIGNSAFGSCYNLASCTIGNGVTSIGQNAFWNCSGLTSIVMPSGVTSIGNNAFYDCTSLSSVTIPSSVTTFGDYAFQGCTSLTSVTIPSSVTTFGNFAFSGCSGLLSVTIDSGVTSIGDYAFMGCSGLTGITIYATTPPTPNGAFYNGNDCPIYVPASSVDAYKAASGWSGFKSRITAIPNS